MAAEALRAYVRDHFQEVPGWAGTPASVSMLETLADMQEGCEPFGALEIGVHHGRYLIALHCACAPGTRSLGIDLFEEQQRNVDASGRGDREAARSNVDAFARDPGLVDLLAADSLTLTSGKLDAIGDEYGGFRFSSVDGGHTPEHVVSDLTSAAHVTVSGGLIILDDFFNTRFPGVTEGFYAVATAHKLPWVPLLVTAKKLFLCHVSLQSTYQSRLGALLAERPVAGVRPKIVAIAGHSVVSVAV